MIWVLWPADEVDRSGAIPVTASDGWSWPWSPQDQDENNVDAEPRAQVADAQLAEVDRLLLGRKADAALTRLGPLLDRHPDHPQLLWRRGKALALQGNHRAALTAYGDALQMDPGLLDDRDFFAELMSLLREPDLLTSAIDLALRHMDEHGHTFLLEQVNRKGDPLSYSERHRVLTALRESPSSAALIDERLQVRLDLEQAAQSRTPCQSFADALHAMAAAPDASYVGPLHRKQPPAPSPENEQNAAACEGLDEKQAKVRSDHVNRFGPPDPKTAAEPRDGSGPSATGSTTRKKRSRDKRKESQKSDKKKRRCDNFAAIFRSECYR